MLGGFRSSIFLFRQPFLLIPGVVASIAVAVWLLLLMTAHGHTSASDLATLALIAPLVGFGFAVLTGLPGFFVVRAFGPKPAPFAPGEGETLVEEVRANHFLRHEGRGGKLFVTDRRVVFVPHRFNVQLAGAEQRLADVREVRWGRILSLSGLPLSSFIELVEDARTERYVVREAAAVGAMIEATALAGPAGG
jgi:hypothetical protein